MRAPETQQPGEQRARWLLSGEWLAVSLVKHTRPNNNTPTNNNQHNTTQHTDCATRTPTTRRAQHKIRGAKRAARSELSVTRGDWTKHGYAAAGNAVLSLDGVADDLPRVDARVSVLLWSLVGGCGGGGGGGGGGGRGRLQVLTPTCRTHTLTLTAQHPRHHPHIITSSFPDDDARRVCRALRAPAPALRDHQPDRRVARGHRKRRR